MNPALFVAATLLHAPTSAEAARGRAIDNSNPILPAIPPISTAPPKPIPLEACSPAGTWALCPAFPDPLPTIQMPRCHR
jgi:hypothetical protein